MPNWHDYNRDPKTGNELSIFLLLCMIGLYILYGIFPYKEKNIQNDKDEIHQTVPEDSLKNIGLDTLKKP